MSLSFGSRIIADPRVLYISGRRGIGIYQLRFSIEFRVPSWADEPNTALLRNLSAYVFSGEERSGDVQPLGNAQPEQQITLQPNQYSQTRTLIFDLNLSPEQVFSLEQIRNGGGIQFVVHIKGEAVGKRGGDPAEEKVNCAVTLSDWARILREFGYADIILLGVALPQVTADSKLHHAVTLVRQANEDLHFGRYDAVVNRCRLALDSLRSALDEKEDAVAAIEKFNSKRRSMNKLERELFVGEAVRHYTQLAHHVDDGAGEPEWYSQGDAYFALALSAASLCNAVNRM